MTHCELFLKSSPSGPTMHTSLREQIFVDNRTYYSSMVSGMSVKKTCLRVFSGSTWLDLRVSTPRLANERAPRAVKSNSIKEWLDTSRPNRLATTTVNSTTRSSRARSADHREGLTQAVCAPGSTGARDAVGRHSGSTFRLRALASSRESGLGRVNWQSIRDIGLFLHDAWRLEADRSRCRLC